MAPRAAVQMQGGAAFRRAMRSTGNDVRDELKAIHLTGAQIVLREALTRVPVRTGTLKNTVRAAGLQTRGEVRAGFARVPYAGPIHFGWRNRNIEPQPFIYDAVDRRRSEVLEAYHDGVDQAARRNGLGPRRLSLG